MGPEDRVELEGLRICGVIHPIPRLKNCFIKHVKIFLLKKKGSSSYFGKCPYSD
jgi:hypothetical protein